MAQVKYNGEYPEGQTNDAGEPYIEQYGETFVRGKSVNVKDEATVAKLAANRFFEVSGESDKEQVQAGAQEAEKAQYETTRAWLEERNVPVHHKMNLKTLEGLKADYLKAQAEANEA